MPEANQRVGEYILEEKVGAGTFGEVWRARHNAWADRVVAVKLPTDRDYVHSLQREGLAIAGLKHPNIVAPINFDPYADPPYLVMEFVPGFSLRQLIAHNAQGMTAEQATAVLKAVLAGLGHAHAKGIIHRDVKPENVLIHRRAFEVHDLALPGAVKLTDFGLGRKVTSPAGSILYSGSMIGDGKVAGTQQYMAPEQLEGKDVDHRADLYACGVMLFEMLTGKRPAGTEVPSDLRPGVPRHLDEAFRRCYARLERRVGSAQELIELIEAPAAPPPVPLEVPPEPPPPPYAPPAPQQLFQPPFQQPPPQQPAMMVATGPAYVPPPYASPAYPPPAYAPPGYGPPVYAQQPYPPPGYAPAPGTNRVAAGILAILFGWLGIHKFVLGFPGAGVTLMLITFLTCGWGSIITSVIGLIEGIIYLSKSDQQFHYDYVVRRQNWF